VGNVIAGSPPVVLFPIVAYRYERPAQPSRPDRRFVLAIVVLQAVVGLATGSATPTSSSQPSWVRSTVRSGSGRWPSVAPLAGVFAREISPSTRRWRASAEYRHVFRQRSLLFGLFFLVFAVIQLSVLLIAGGRRVRRPYASSTSCARWGWWSICLRYITRHLGERLRLAGHVTG